MVLDLAIPAPKRVQNSMKPFTAKPDRNTIAENTALATPTIGARLMRSASQPMGKAPSTTNAAEADAMNVMVPSDTPKLSRMSGASTAMAACSSSSRLLSTSSTTNVNAPPMASPLRSGISSSPTPGRRSSANSTCSPARAWASRRTDSSASSAAVSAAVLSPGVPAASAELPVAPGSSSGWCAVTARLSGSCRRGGDCGRLGVGLSRRGAAAQPWGESAEPGGWLAP